MALSLLQLRQKPKTCDYCEKVLSKNFVTLQANGYSNLGFTVWRTWMFCSEECQDLWKEEMMEKRWDLRSRK